MSIPALDDEQLREAVRVGQECDWNWVRTAERLGLRSRHSAQNRVFQAYSKLPELRGRVPYPGFKITKLSTKLDADGSVAGEYIQQKPETTEEPFEAPLGFTPKKVTYHVKDGNVVQSWPRFSPDDKSPEEIAEVIKAALDGYEPPPRQMTPAPAAYDERLANVFLVPDGHMGALAWDEETGTGNWDVKTATRTIKNAMARLVANSPEAEQGVVLGLGDNSHTDGYKNVTPQSGHFLDVDGRYPRVLKATTECFLDATELALLKHERVLVRVLPGNHDPTTAIGVAHALALYFHNEPRVTVDDSASPFWWWEWGSTLVGATHGDKAKMKDLPIMMASRNPEAWGRTTFRYVYTGHVHHQSAMEIGGVIVESFRSPAAPDAFNAARYSSGRSLRAVTLDRTTGEIGRQTVNIV